MLAGYVARFKPRLLFTNCLHNMTDHTTVILSNGQQARVRRLGLFELDDNIDKPNLEPYTVTILFSSGEIFNQPYDLSVIRYPPDTPFESCEEKSQDWFAWREYHRYTEGLVYEEKRIQAYVDYSYTVAEFIRTHAVLDKLPDDITTEDWAEIGKAALCHTVGMADINKAIDQLGGQWNGESLLEAYRMVPRSKGSYDFRVVELDMMLSLNESEQTYFARPVMERARLIAKDQIRDMIKALEIDAANKEAQAHGA